MKYKIDYTSKFKKQYKHKGEKYKKLYKNCKECHIKPDWLLIYKFNNDELILLLLATGSHSELFK